MGWEPPEDYGRQDEADEWEDRRAQEQVAATEGTVPQQRRYGPRGEIGRPKHWRRR